MFIWCKIKIVIVLWNLLWWFLLFLQAHRYTLSYDSKIDNDVKIRANLLTNCMNERHAQFSPRFYRAHYLVVSHYIYKMSKRENDEPRDAECCEAVRIGQYGNEAELTIFYTPKKGLCSHCRTSRASYKLEQGYWSGSLLRQILRFTTDTWQAKTERFQMADGFGTSQ